MFLWLMLLCFILASACALTAQSGRDKTALFWALLAWVVFLWAIQVGS